MSQIISAVPPVQPAVPSETPHGGHGHAQSARQVQSYKQALAHQPARDSKSAATVRETPAAHVQMTDKDGNGQGKDGREHSAQQELSANGSATEGYSPAAIVSISSAARAAITHESGSTRSA